MSSSFAFFSSSSSHSPLGAAPLARCAAISSQDNSSSEYSLLSGEASNSGGKGLVGLSGNTGIPKSEGEALADEDELCNTSELDGAGGGVNSCASL